MEFRDVVRKRRMVRSFADEPVAEDALHRILDAARRGPSAGFSQGVEFVVVTDPTLKAQLSPPPEKLASAGVRNFTEQAPVVIAVCTSDEVYRARYREADKERARGGAGDAELWHVPYWHTDAGAALMLILLAAVDEGLSAGVAGVMGAEGQGRIQRALGMPDTYTAIALVAVGHAAPGASALRGSAKARARRPMDEVVHHERW